MSTLYVDTINEKTSGNGIKIPGHVVKETLVDVTPSSTFTNSTSTYAQAFAGSFTPQLSTSTIIADISFYYRSYRSNGSDGRGKFRVLVDGTQEFEVIEVGGYDYGGSGPWIKQNVHANIEINNTTGSAVSVAVQCATNGGLGVNVYAGNEGRATIRFTEIAG